MQVVTPNRTHGYLQEPGFGPTIETLPLEPNTIDFAAFFDLLRDGVGR